MQNVTIGGFRRITKREAIVRFNRGEQFVLCPRKLIPGGGFACHSTVYPKEIQERKERYGDDAWNSLIREWAWYNASWEAGYYPAFYVTD